MHEFSIAEALAAQVLRHAPASGRVSEVEIRVGALRGLEPEAMKMCWEAVTHDTPLAGSVLRIDLRPWSVACPACGRVWESPVPFAECSCGEASPRPTAGDELDLVSMTVDEDDDTVGAEAGAEAEAR
ncbi:MAG TPA: hydrogenase maturation nickel metallochaperone HypA [Candidatus Limnocylindrales bacterium]